jgi:HEAT repeats
VDGRTTLAIICAVAGGGWLLLALGVLVGRLRASRRPIDAALAPVAEWHLCDERSELLGAMGATEDEVRSLLERGVRSAEPEVRIAAVTTLGRLGDRYEWAIDGLIDALAAGVEHPVRVAAQLDRLAPRPGRRLTPLIGHPSDLVRFCAIRLLARYPALARSHAVDLTRDPSPNVRAAALETLRASASAEAFRCALRLLDDPHSLVRAHACRTASAIAGATSAPFVATLLGDESWWVREAAREALVTLGRDVAPFVAPLLEADDPTLHSGAALVLQDVGALDDLLRDDVETVEAERILAAGGPRLRDAARDRAQRGIRLGSTPGGLPAEAVR